MKNPKESPIFTTIGASFAKIWMNKVESSRVLRGRGRQFALCCALVLWCGGITIALVVDTYAYFAFETNGMIESSHWDWIKYNGRLRNQVLYFSVRTPAGVVEQQVYPGQMLVGELKPGTVVTKTKYSLSYYMNGHNMFWPQWQTRLGEVLISSALFLMGICLSIRWGF